MLCLTMVKYLMKGSGRPVLILQGRQRAARGKEIVMARLAVLILTYNEEKNIEKCIASAAFADEVVVIDSGSSDATRELAKAMGARVVVNTMESFGVQRNFAATQTEADWILYLDADERITPELAVEIRQAVESGTPCAYNLRRVSYIFGQRMLHGAHRPDESCRLYPRGSFTWEGIVHETVRLTVPVKQLHQELSHYTYDSWAVYFAKFDKYTSMMAKKMHEQGKRASLFDIVFRPAFGFFRAYILRAGFLDGELGLVFSVIHAYYTFVKYIKLRYIDRLE